MQQLQANLSNAAETVTDTVGDLSVWVFALIATLTLYSCIKLKQARKRKNKMMHNSKYIEKGKIVLAIEIKDFFIKYSQKQESGYLPLGVKTSRSFVGEFLDRMLSWGHFYKPIFPINKIKQFMSGLNSIEKAYLLVYTSLSPEVLEVILSKLGIQKFFPPERRKYCDLENHDDQKHAIEVDQDSRRVIIITPAYDDHRQEDDKYFLVLRPKRDEPNFLKQWMKELKVFVQANENINNLHEELAQFKINFDSELSDYEI